METPGSDPGLCHGMLLVFISWLAASIHFPEYFYPVYSNIKI